MQVNDGHSITGTTVDARDHSQLSHHDPALSLYSHFCKGARDFAPQRCTQKKSAISPIVLSRLSANYGSVYSLIDGVIGMARTDFSFTPASSTVDIKFEFLFGSVSSVDKVDNITLVAV